MINIKHLDRDPTSAAWREVDGASKTTRETLRGKKRREKKNIVGRGGKSWNSALEL